VTYGVTRLICERDTTGSINDDLYVIDVPSREYEEVYDVLETMEKYGWKVTLQEL
jgi:hypothetical protein